MTLNNLNSDDDTIYDSLLLLSERLNKYSQETKKQSKITNFINKI